MKYNLDKLKDIDKNFGPDLSGIREKLSEEMMFFSEFRSTNEESCFEIYVFTKVGIYVICKEEGVFFFEDLNGVGKHIKNYASEIKEFIKYKDYYSKRKNESLKYLSILKIYYEN